MGNARTTSLHDRLPAELRKQVECDLVEQPPGRATYQEVYEHYQLDVHGVSLSALGRYGGYLRGLARDQWIRELGDHVAGQDLAPRIQAVVRSKLYEALVVGETKIGDLVKAAMTEKMLGESEIKAEQWNAKKRELKAGVEQLAARDGSHHVDAAKVADLIDKVMRGESIATADARG